MNDKVATCWMTSRNTFSFCWRRIGGQFLNGEWKVVIMRCKSCCSNPETLRGKEKKTHYLDLRMAKKQNIVWAYLYSEDRTQKLWCFKLQKFHSHGCHFLGGPSIGSTTNNISGESHEKHHTGKLLTTLNQVTYAYGFVVSQPRSQGLFPLPPLALGKETLVAAGHVTTCDTSFSTGVEWTNNFCRSKLKRKKVDRLSSLC